jgi:hypothetical protein
MLQVGATGINKPTRLDSIKNENIGDKEIKIRKLTLTC